MTGEIRFAALTLDEEHDANKCGTHSSGYVRSDGRHLVDSFNQWNKTVVSRSIPIVLTKQQVNIEPGSLVV
jgi:hypothetical protein